MRMNTYKKVAWSFILLLAVVLLPAHSFAQSDEAQVVGKPYKLFSCERIPNLYAVRRT